MKSESPVFIVGAARSGTSLLYRILQKHSSFKLHNEDGYSQSNLVESDIFQKLYLTSHPNFLSYMLGNETYYNQFLQSTEWVRRYQNLIFAPAISRKLFRRSYLKQIRYFFWQVTLSNYLVGNFFYYAQQARGVKRILEKTPASIYYLPEIKTTFPNSKLIFIHRHPVDVYSSYKKRLKVSQDLDLKPSQLIWLKITHERFCQDYTRSINLAVQESQENPEQFLLIAYEDLVNYPQETINKICDFLKENYEEACIPEDETKNANYKIDSHLFGSIEKSTKNWQDFISEEEAKTIENHLSQVMAKLNYPKYT